MELFPSPNHHHRSAQANRLSFGHPNHTFSRQKNFPANNRQVIRPLSTNRPRGLGFYPNQNYPTPMNQRTSFPMRQSSQGAGGKLRQLVQNFINPTSLSSDKVEGLSNTLGNVQQVLRMVQSAAPLVEEYGTMIKNIPMMYRMYKAFKEINAEEDEENEEKQLVSENATRVDPKEFQTDEEEREDKKAEKRKYGESVPKLYI